MNRLHIGIIRDIITVSRMSDSCKKSVLKTLTWRIVGFLTTTMIVFVLTGHWGTSFFIGGIEAFTKMVFYYYHERIWNLIKI